jgi:hypothetical protein
MWQHLGNVSIGNFSYIVFPVFFNSSVLKFDFVGSSVPSGYFPINLDRLIVAREFLDNSTEYLGQFYIQNLSQVLSINPAPLSYSDFKLKIKKIPRYKYGLMLNVDVYYWS